MKNKKLTRFGLAITLVAASILPSTALAPIDPTETGSPWSSAMLRVRLHEAAVKANVRVASGSPSGFNGPEMATVAAGA